MVPQPDAHGTVCTEILPEGAFRGLSAFLGEFNLKEGSWDRSAGSWLTTLLFGFTFMVLNTGYTAVVTTRLLQASTTTITSLEQAISANYRICVNQDLVSVLVAPRGGHGPIM